MESAYTTIEVVGTRATSWEDAAKRAVAAANQRLRDLRVAEITPLEMAVDNGKVSVFRARVSLPFKYDPASKAKPRGKAKLPSPPGGRRGGPVAGRLVLPQPIGTT